MPEDPSELNNPNKIAEAGERIYSERYKADLEKSHPGEFVCVDVLSGNFYLGRYPEQAMKTAREEAPSGIFHLIKIGSPGAFRTSYTLRRNEWWIRVPGSSPVTPV